MKSNGNLVIIITIVMMLHDIGIFGNEYLSIVLLTVNDNDNTIHRMATLYQYKEHA